VIIKPCDINFSKKRDTMSKIKILRFEVKTKIKISTVEIKKQEL